MQHHKPTGLSLTRIPLVALRETATAIARRGGVGQMEGYPT